MMIHGIHMFTTGIQHSAIVSLIGRNCYVCSALQSSLRTEQVLRRVEHIARVQRALLMRFRIRQDHPSVQPFVDRATTYSFSSAYLNIGCGTYNA